MAGDDLTLLGHIAFIRRYATELRAFAGETAPKIARRLHQIAHELEADAEQLEKVTTSKGLITEE
jgi:hypothetical protein